MPHLLQTREASCYPLKTAGFLFVRVTFGSLFSQVFYVCVLQRSHASWDGLEKVDIATDLPFSGLFQGIDGLQNAKSAVDLPTFFINPSEKG